MTNPRELVERLNKMVATPRVSFNYQEDVDAVAAAAAALSAALDREERLEADNTRLRGLLEEAKGVLGPQGFPKAGYSPLRRKGSGGHCPTVQP